MNFAEWFESRRGILPATLEAFGVQFDGDEARFPYPGDAVKVRVGMEKEERRFFWQPPTAAGQVPFLPPDFEPGTHMLLLEGESDTMAAWQSATDAWKPHIVGLSGLNAWKAEYATELFGQAKKIFFVADNDDPYSPAQDQGDKAWQTIRGALGRKARRVVLPQGIEDVADFFTKYDWPAFRVLLKRADEPKRFYRRLDLSKDPPPTDWLIEDLIVSGEVTVLAGDSGVGKSFLTKSLALAVAGNRPLWLDFAVQKHGRVLYVDEENSAQLVLQRLNALAADIWGVGSGIPLEVRNNLEYLWYAGVQLDTEPEKLLEEALEIEPVLIVVDSQSRVALNTEENSNDQVTRLFQRGLIPLARDTGAAVVVLHHTPKDGRGPRGAGAIKAAADQAIEVVAAENKAGVKTGKLNIFPSKPRRQTAYLQARIVGDIEKEGWVRVERAEEEDPF